MVGGSAEALPVVLRPPVAILTPSVGPPFHLPDNPYPSIGMPGETFKQYVDSLSYGSRTDLLFKFLKNLPEEAAEGFLQSVFHELGNIVDSGDTSPLFRLIYEAQLAAYSPPDEEVDWTYEDAPFTPLKKPLSEMRVGLLTSSGHYVDGEPHAPPALAGYSQEEGVRHIDEYGRAKPFLAAVPIDVPVEQLRVHQPGYDIRAALEDRNTVMPIDRMRELEADGVIGEFARTAYSFIGLASQLRLKKEQAPEWAERVRAEGWDAAVLVPI